MLTLHSQKHFLEADYPLLLLKLKAYYMDTQVFSQRLKNARIMKRLTLDELCARINGVVSKAAISKYENGKMEPSDEVKLALAHALDVDVTYFERPFDDGIEKCEIDFRKKSSLPKSEEKALTLTAREKVERYIEIRKILRNAGVEPQSEPLKKTLVRTREDARSLASALRKKWGLDERPILDAQSLLEKVGVMVIPIAARDEFDGMSATVTNVGEMFIVINTSKAHVERRRLTTFHEYAHQIMDMPDVEAREKESLCHEFASEMLLPTDVIRSKYEADLRQLQKSFSLLKLRAVQMNYGISIDAIVKKAATLGFISKSKYTYYNIYKAENPSYQKAVEESVFQEWPHEYDCFSMKVLDALSRKLITPEKAKSLLHDADEIVRIDLDVLA